MIRKLAAVVAVATLSLGVTAAPADAAHKPNPSRSGWGCGGAC